MQGIGGWLWLLIDVGLVAVLALALLFGLARWRQRYRDPATREVRDDATERLYQKGD